MNTTKSRPQNGYDTRKLAVWLNFMVFYVQHK